MKDKPYHYWAIHRRVFRKLWNNAPFYVRDIVSNAATWCPEYDEFMSRLDKETVRLFNDPEFFYNERTTFTEQPRPVIY